MSSSTKPAILIIHGAWHVPDSFTKFTSSLRDAGFEVHIPRLLSCNQSRPPNADLTSDTDLIRSYATSLIEAGRTLVVLMHSYGGQVGTNALYGLSATTRAIQSLPGGITHLIYLTAFALPQATSLISKAREFPPCDRMAIDLADDHTCVANFPIQGLIGQQFIDRVAADHLSAYLRSLVRWNARCMYLPIENTPAWRDEVQVCYIFAEADLAIPIEYQRSMVEFMETQGKNVSKVRVATGHMAHLTEPRATLDAVLHLIS